MGTWKGHLKMRRLKPRKSLVLGHTDSRVRTKEKSLRLVIQCSPHGARGILSACLLPSHRVCLKPSLRAFIFIHAFIFPASLRSPQAPEAAPVPGGLQVTGALFGFFLSCSHMTRSSALRSPASGCLILPASSGASLSSSLGHFCELLSVLTDH